VEFLKVDIRSGNKYPAGALSNFKCRPFIFRGHQIMSMEGFLQGLKFNDKNIQLEVFEMVGLAAKRRGARKNWGSTLWLFGQPIERNGKEYQNILDEAYEAMFTQNEKARKALIASGNATLTHSIGRKNANETVLTRTEFCSRLIKIRDEIIVPK
jgi:predicted NAD-dependent protein-ADP-ribosyltransferase YbiA (DUF1768 family)